MALEFDAEDMTRPPRQRQRKIADPAVQVEDTMRGFDLQQVDCRCHHQPVHGPVHLDEIRCAELDVHIEVGQSIDERLVPACQRLDRRRATGLQPDLDAIARRKGRQRFPVG